MAHEAATQHHAQSFSLPHIVFGPVEVRRLRRELEALEAYMAQAALRESGKAQATLPRTSHILETLAEENHLNLLQAEDRKALAGWLDDLLGNAPVLHMSFASDPSAAFTAKLVAWLRQHIHPHALLRVGLQPTIAAGCILRTTNKSFDFSLRHRFDESRQMLISSLEGGQSPQSEQQPAAQPHTQAQSEAQAAAQPAEGAAA